MSDETFKASGDTRLTSAEIGYDLFSKDVVVVSTGAKITHFPCLNRSMRMTERLSASERHPIEEPVDQE